MFTIMSMSYSSRGTPRRAKPTKTSLRACLPHFHTTETEATTHEVRRKKPAVKVPSQSSVPMPGRRTNHSWSDTEEITFLSINPNQSRRKRRQHSSSPYTSLCTASSTSCTLSAAKKGVTYGHNGALVSCRFCKIVESGNEAFLYHDDDVVVFRPLAPVVVSHILVVPRRHIRNVNKLTPDEATLLRRMREIAAMVLREMPRPSAMVAPSNDERAYDIAEDSTEEKDVESDFKFAFHSPPFNSIDHVHMHAFRTRDGRFGCVGSIKYRTETWWCRSFDKVMTRLGVGNCKQRNTETVKPVMQNKEHRRKHHVYHDSANGSMVLMAV